MSQKIFTNEEIFQRYVVKAVATWECSRWIEDYVENLKLEWVCVCVKNTTESCTSRIVSIPRREVLFLHHVGRLLIDF